MDPRFTTIAVTALNATDNPGPGISVIRALRDAPEFRGCLVGLAYDTMDPGCYADDIVDDVFLLPYPSQGRAALLQRIRAIHARIGLDVIIPTLDSELDAFIAIERELAAMGIGLFLPTREQLKLRSKARLARLGEEAGISVPPTRLVSDPAELYRLHEQIPFPVFMKGQYYGATLARSVHEAVAAFHEIVAQWGVPVIAQSMVGGEEYDVVAVGDGHGGLVGAVPMKKISLTDKGKGWAGVTIRDEALIDLTRRFMEATHWRGPCEVEVMKDDRGCYHLLEINPRFPAWTYLSAGAGMNLCWAVARLAMGLPVAPMETYRVGTMFVRISLDQIADISQLQKLSATGELLGSPTLSLACQEA